ncbi:MAG: hypothetical protein LBL44_03475, partial [Treponema sp.]|nr:hypothetical protein [Treponema sp.]
MPSLQALQEFKTSFNHIGGETASLREQNIPFDDLPLPGQTGNEGFPTPSGIEAEAGPAAASPDLDFNLDDFADMDLGGEAPPDFAASPAGGQSVPAAPPAAGTPEPEGDGLAGDMDFGAFLDNIPDDLSLPESAADEPLTDLGGEFSGLEDLDAGTAAEGPTAEEAPAEEMATDDDFSIPGDLLSGLGEDLDVSAAAEEPAADEPSMDLGGEFSGLEDLDTGAAAEEPAAEEAPAGDDFSIPGDLLSGLGEDLDTGAATGEPADEPSMDLGGEFSGLENLDTGMAIEEPAADEPSMDLGGEFSGLEDLDTGAATEEPATEEPSMDLGGEFSGLEDLDVSAAAEEPAIEEPSMDLGGEFSGLEDLDAGAAVGEPAAG